MAIVYDRPIYRSGSLVKKMYRSGNLIYWRLNPVEEEPDDNTIPLTFEIISGGTIIWKKGGANAQSLTIYYNINDGGWESITANDTAGTAINVSVGDIIQFSGNNATYGTTGSYYQSCGFGGTAKYYAYGNIMSLIYGDNFIGQTTLNENFTFVGLFYGASGLTSHNTHKLILPATTLTVSCYNSMFYGTNITAAPELPATNLATSCYLSMFSNTPLISAPQLPATTLTQSCYNSMFSYCTNITTAPELPATTLAEQCYNYMFAHCSSLNYVKCLATDISATLCTRQWLDSVAATGTFVKDASMTGWTTGVDGIPTNWTVENYPPTPVLPSNTFLINYNAKFYNNSTFTIPKTEGQLFNEDMVLNAAASSYTSDHITVNGQYFEKSFGSTGANPFNLTNSSPFTLIAKTSRGFDTSGEHSLASCRSGGLNWILFNPGNGSGADKVFMHNSQRLYSQTPYATITTEPNVYAIRLNNGSGYGESYTDSTTERSISVSYNGNSDRFGIFTDTVNTGGFELWKGDFYWMYISTEALTDDEIQQVINYNENINPTNE